MVLSSVSSSTLTTVCGAGFEENPRVLDSALEKRVLDECNRKFGVKFSTFRKNLNIYSCVPGDSDHHPCMTQGTIRGEPTRLL